MPLYWFIKVRIQNLSKIKVNEDHRQSFKRYWNSRVWNDNKQTDTKNVPKRQTHTIRNYKTTQAVKQFLL